jgi:hypothetical protein
MTGTKLSEEQQKLHRRLIRLRNKIFAHSDAELMRMVAKAEPIDVDNGFSFVFLQTIFDVGLTFIGSELIELTELFHYVFHGAYTKLLHEAQARPADFNLRKDYLNE